MVENRKRQNQIKIYLNDKETELLEEKSKIFGKNKSEFLRQGIIRSDPEELRKFNDNFEKLIIQYKAVGNNINQLARAVNQGRLRVESQEFEKLRIEVNNIWVLLKSLKEGRA
ncbi:plasmid mobilization protein [Proteocatella sphenisci]|uniref:plasmid mobilization protein n=1 Tax=Proteocatella sphenisci TaxID=181070 RepID=UPI00048E1CD8|nr:plasmid mobilization relaxosome protein MobC [Proteocatella sphenisci]